MYSFECDYLEGCHEKILEALTKNNMIQEPGYGSDSFTAEAKDRIRASAGCPEADIYFVTGGTQTNQLVIDTMLESYEGVLAAQTGHVSIHEAGAIEYSGHKVLPLPSHNGKVDANEVRETIDNFYQDGNHEHMVFPGMLYISYPTEYGTLYTADELRALADLCRSKHIPLFIDGARLGYGLQAKGTDVSLELIAEVSDVFYIGGTKIGALCGEAIVFPHNNAPKHFMTHMKQHGALSAKGRLFGIQFSTLFTDDLYLHISRHAIDKAMQIKAIFQDAGVSFYLDSPTNQQFVILENSKMEKLKQYVRFGFWEKYDETHTVVRFASSWATTDTGIRELREAVKKVFGDE